MEGKVLDFQNREKELADAVRSLSKELVLLVGMPAMGKTRFIRQIPIELTKQGRSLRVVHVDLDDQLSLAKSNFEILIRKLFSLAKGSSEDKDVLHHQIAHIIAHSDEPWLLLLDQAELLSNENAVKLRRLLCRVIQKLRKDGFGDRLGFVAASREEIPAFKGVIPQPAFKTIILKQFNPTVITRVLERSGRKEGRDEGEAPAYTHIGQSVFRETEGLPTLLTRSLGWLKRADFASNHAWDSELFEIIVRPYIQRELLSPRGLLPARILTKMKEVDPADTLVRALASLLLRGAAFRLLTRSHLTILREQDSELHQAMDTIETFGEDAYQLLGKLSIVEPSTEPWHTLYGAARRLLFKYQCTTAPTQLAAHQHAVTFYERWGERLSGRNLAQFLIEKLWHQVEIERLRCTDDTLERVRAHFRHIENSTDDIAVRLEVRHEIDSDNELQRSLRCVDPQLIGELLV